MCGWSSAAARASFWKRLAKEPPRRYGSAGERAEDLRR